MSAIYKGFRLSVVLAGGLLGGTLLAFADTAPSGRVARLTFTDGYVHVDRVEGGAGDPAQLNMPLVEGQTIVTGENGQAEVEFEDGSVARVTPNSSLRLAKLTVDGGGNYNTQLGLVKGLAYFELRSAPRFTYLVDAGGDLVTPAENTTVRVDLDEAPAAVAVLDGTAHVEKAGSYRMDVHAGETFRADISGAGRYFLTQEVASDTWDQWNEARDQVALDVAPKQTTARDGYAGSQGYGWSDLDANGSWYDVPGQGQVWQPQGGDDAGFDPYGNGSWVYYQGAGYTWASGYSWGWTPFRCGGWSFWDSFGWGWSPNGGCGGFGFAGYGGGGYGYGGYGYGGLNIVRAPLHYPVHRPGNGGPGVHPIIRVGGAVSVRPITGTLQGPRRIAGVVATPLRPIGASYTQRGGSAVGASLRNDFPVDRTTHTPVLGVQPSHTATEVGVGGGRVPSTGLSQGFVGRPGNASGVPPANASGLRPGFQQGMRPTVQQQGFQQQQGLRPVNPGVQGGYARPGMQQQMGSHPMQQQSAPRYSAPAQQQQMSHPSFSAPAPAMHSAPASAPAASGHK